jgi:hypothetical protein
MDIQSPSSYIIWDLSVEGITGRSSNLIIQDFAEVTLTMQGEWSRVRWEVTKVLRKLEVGKVFYTIPIGEVSEEAEDLLHVGLCVLARIYTFIGSYAIVQFTTLEVDVCESRKSILWIHTSLLHIPRSHLLEAQRAELLFPGFAPSSF